ncbi:hypothetical protein BGZ96_007036 [Linnemannia gamsii]|uniref:RGS domain-containing protein n=1 Tax=Linnemannia gamsii TaxID=64522 RepID=A0ABQ7KDX5_9FUNG|nr:hypothetical protein BGZ96_007036 [Linnemannia gamsii]
MSGPLGPYGPVLGMGHRYVYFTAGVIMGSICLISTIITFILAKTHNDLKQRGRYLVFWNGLSATGVVTIYLMLNAFVGDFPCYILLWTCYLCIVPWLLTYLARGWRLVFIYNQQVDFGRTILQKSATELNILHHNSNNSPNEGANNPVNDVDDAVGTVARTGVEGRKITVVEEKEGLDRHYHNNNTNAEKDQGEEEDAVGGSSSQADLLERVVAGSIKHESAGDASTTIGERGGEGVGVGGKPMKTVRAIRVDTPTKQRLEAPLPPIPRTLSQLPVDSSVCHQLVVSIAPPSPVADSPTSITAIMVNPHGSSATSTSDVTSPRSLQTEYNPCNVFHAGTIKDAGAIQDHAPSRTMSLTVDGEAVKDGRSCSRYLPFNQATDGRLTIFLIIFMIIPLIICLGMQFIRPSPVQINPISYKCGEGPVFYPIYGFMLTFLAICCPVLTYKLWWIKDGFGIRNELLITMIIGLPGFALYFLSPIYLKKLDAGHWNHVNWLILTIFLAQVNSVVLPLIQFFLRQRPKQRTGKNPFTGIFRWDSYKSYPGTPTLDMNSDTSSFHFHSRSSSQVISPHIPEHCNSSIFERQSVSHQSILSPSQNIHGFLSDDFGYSSIQASQSVTTTGQGVEHRHRRRGMKGFWLKYGKDVNGNIIPLSQMNPRAFEYALQDLEMLTELVKFSVTVFSAENAKFLQEYEGLRRQVREYYRLITQGRSHGSKHSRRLSDVASSARAQTEDGSVRGSDRLPCSHKKKSFTFGSVASSIHSKLSKCALSSVDNSAKANSDSNHDSNFSVPEDESIIRDGDPGSSTPRRPTGPNVSKSFGRHRQDLRGNLWRLSLQSSLRQSSTTQSSPQGSIVDDAASQITAERRSVPSAAPFSPPGVSSESSHRHQSSDLTISSLDDATESRNGFSGNDSDQSSFSWYGRGNSGSALSYHDVTPSELSSYQDAASETFGYHAGYFGGNGETDSVAGYRRGGSDDIGSISVSLNGPSLREHRQGCEGPSQTSGCSCPIPIPSKRATGSVTSSQDFVRSASAPSSRGTIQSPTSPLHHAHQSAESSPMGSSVGDGNRDGMTTYSTMKQQQHGRLNQSFSSSPFHSPSSSVSAPFTPRLPSQPQLHNPTTIRASQGLIPRSVSARTILTAEDYRQQQHHTSSASSSNMSSGPLSSLSSQQQQLPITTAATSPVPGVTSSRMPHLPQQTPSIASSAIRTPTQPRPLHNHQHLQHQRSDLGSRSDFHTDVVMPTPNGRTPVPKALMAAFWEIYQTFILANSILELNLSEAHVSEVKRLFANNECYLEMYEPIVREVQELVYSNVWPRFIQSIQRQPQGFPGKFKRTWKAFFGKGPEDQGDGIYDGQMGMSELFGYNGRIDHQQGEEGYRGSEGEEVGGGGGKEIATKSYLPSLPPPQASYIHGQFAYLGGSEIPGLEGLNVRVDHSAGQVEKNYGSYGDEHLDLGRFGVMQELDFSALERIVIDPK